MGLYYIPMARALLVGHGQATGGDHGPVWCRATRGNDIPEPIQRGHVIGKNTLHTLVYLFASQKLCLCTLSCLCVHRPSDGEGVKLIKVSDPNELGFLSLCLCVCFEISSRPVEAIIRKRPFGFRTINLNPGFARRLV